MGTDPVGPDRTAAAPGRGGPRAPGWSRGARGPIRIHHALVAVHMRNAARRRFPSATFEGRGHARRRH